MLRTSSDMNRPRIPSSSLFDACGFLREANKPTLADAISGLLHVVIRRPFFAKTSPHR